MSDTAEEGAMFTGGYHDLRGARGRDDLRTRLSTTGAWGI